jgi:RHS repeat-associated protein
MDMPGRSVTPIDNYKYSFNGKLDDKSDGWQTQDYGFRSYDKRLGRFFSEDPLTGFYSYLSPYAFAANRCIEGIDLEGGEFLRTSVIKFIHSPAIALKNKEEMTANGNIGILDANNLFVKYKQLSILLAVSNSKGPSEDDGVSKGWVINKYGINAVEFTKSFNKKTGTSSIIQNKGKNIIENKEYIHPVSKGESVGVGVEIISFYQQRLAANAAWDYYYLNQIDKVAFYKAAEVVNNAIDLGIIPADYSQGQGLTNLYNCVLSEDFKNQIAQKNGDLYLKHLAEYIYENMSMINNGLDPSKNHRLIYRVLKPFSKFGFEFKMINYIGKPKPVKTKPMF